MHAFGRFEDSGLVLPATYQGRSSGYRQASLVGPETGAVHTGLTLNELAPGGSIDPHVHSFEESFYLLSGEATVTLGGTSYTLGPGDYGAAKVGLPHAWNASPDGPVRWLQMAAPQPKPSGGERDTFFLANRALPIAQVRPDASTIGENLLGHFDASQIPPPGARQSAGAGLEGVFLKWLLDENVGVRHHRLLFIEYQPGVGIGLHDHTFEEAYFILSGEVEAVLDGQRYRATPGSVLWTGVGCVHSFTNVSAEPVRWLETFAPQPPKENVFRFIAEWQARAQELEGSPI